MKLSGDRTRDLRVSSPLLYHWATFFKEVLRVLDDEQANEETDEQRAHQPAPVDVVQSQKKNQYSGQVHDEKMK